MPVPGAALGVKRPIDPGTHTVGWRRPTGWGAGGDEVHGRGRGAANAAPTLTKPSEVAAGAAGTATPGSSDQGAATASTTSTPAGADTGTSPGSTQRTLGLVGMGVGVVGLGVGAVTGILAIGKHSSLSNECTLSGGSCPASANSDLDSYHSMATISTIGFIAGGVLAAGGAVLFLTAPHASSSGPATGLRLTPFIGPGSVGAVGTF